MQLVRADNELRSKLANFSVPLAICDESGRVLAHVVPQADLSQYDLTQPLIDRDEVGRRKNSDQWYTTAEVLDYLRSLEQTS